MDILLDLILQVINDMNQYGVCVVDNFLGEERGKEILKEVFALESSGAFADGQVVKQQQQQKELALNGSCTASTSTNSLLANQSKVRGDKITWVDGHEPICKNISVLIALIGKL